jgi:hypothetical protein
MSAAGYVLQEAWCLGPVLEGCNLIDLWRLQGVSRAFKGKCAEALRDLGSLLVCGGLESVLGSALGSVHLLSLDAMRWREGPSLPQGLFDHACVAQSDGTVLCIGGGSRVVDDSDVDPDFLDQYSEFLFALEPGAEEWVQRSLLHCGRRSFAAKACEDGTVLMLGGFDRDWSDIPTTRVDRLDPATGVVTPLPSLLHAACGSWTVPGKRMVFTTGRTAQVYDTSTAVSTQLPDIPFVRVQLPDIPFIRVGSAGVALPDSRCGVLGGFCEDAGSTTSCIAYNDKAGAWEELPELLAPRSTSATWLVGGCVVILGGADREGLDGRMEVLDLKAGKWRYVPGAEVGFHFGSCALVPR